MVNGQWSMVNDNCLLFIALRQTIGGGDGEMIRPQDGIVQGKIHYLESGAAKLVIDPDKRNAAIVGSAQAQAFFPEGIIKILV